MPSQTPAKHPHHTGLVPSIINAALLLFRPAAELSAHNCFELFHTHLDINVLKSLSSLELVGGGCLFSDLLAPRGADLNLFGHELRVCKPIIPI